MARGHPRPFRARAYVGVTTDVVATIYDAVGHTPALPLDGESLLPLLAAAAAAEAAEARPEDDVRRRGPARFVTPNAAAALAPDGQTKLVFHARVNTRVAARDGRWYTPCVAHLFDLAADPGEEQGVPDSPARRATVAAMSRDLEAWLDGVARSYFGADYPRPFDPLDPRYPGPGRWTSTAAPPPAGGPATPLARLCDRSGRSGGRGRCAARRAACAGDSDCCSRRCNPSGKCGRARQGAGDAQGWHACAPTPTWSRSSRHRHGVQHVSLNMI